MQTPSTNGGGLLLMKTVWSRIIRLLSTTQPSWVRGRSSVVDVYLLTRRKNDEEAPREDHHQRRRVVGQQQAATHHHHQQKET